MRLAIVSDTYPPQLNGVARTLGRLAECAMQSGADVRVFTTTDPNAHDEAHVHRFRSVPFWAYPQLRIGFPGARSMEAALRIWRPTLVHVATPFGMGLAARTACARLNIPLVSSYHTSLTSYATHYHLGVLASSGWSFLRWFHNGAGRTYCPTRTIKDELATRGFRNTALWPRGVDGSLFHPARRSLDLRESLGVRRGEVLVGYVGRVAREKGIADLLRAFGALALRGERTFRLLVVGDGPHLHECRRTAPAGTIFVGSRTGCELAAFYASLDLFAFPSVTDTFGNVLLEAMASGVPVVAADCPTTREVLGDYAAGWYAASDYRELAQALAALADDHGRARQVAARALKAVRARTWRRIFGELFRDYLLVSGVGQAAPDFRPAA